MGWMRHFGLTVRIGRSGWDFGRISVFSQQTLFESAACWCGWDSVDPALRPTLGFGRYACDVERRVCVSVEREACGITAR